MRSPTGCSTQWSVLLEVEANNARIDAAQELVTVAHDQGVYVVQMSTQSVYWNVSSVDRVDDAVIDNEGELWLAFFAGKRRADQYDTTGYTGISSTTISAGISSLEILNDGRLVMASYDKKIYVLATDVSLSTTLPEPYGIVSYMDQTYNSSLLAGTTGGTIYHYEIDTWTASNLGLGHTKQTTLLAAHNGMYIAGSKQGKVAFIDQSNLTIIESFSASGDIIAVVPEYTGQFFAVGALPSKRKFAISTLTAILTASTTSTMPSQTTPRRQRTAMTTGTATIRTETSPMPFPTNRRSGPTAMVTVTATTSAAKTLTSSQQR